MNPEMKSLSAISALQRPLGDQYQRIEFTPREVVQRATGGFEALR